MDCCAPKLGATEKNPDVRDRCDAAVDCEAVVCRSELDTQPSQLLRDDADMAVVVGVRKVAWKLVCVVARSAAGQPGTHVVPPGAKSTRRLVGKK